MSAAVLSPPSPSPSSSASEIAVPNGGESEIEIEGEGKRGELTPFARLPPPHAHGGVEWMDALRVGRERTRQHEHGIALWRDWDVGLKTHMN